MTLVTWSWQREEESNHVRNVRTEAGAHASLVGTVPVECGVKLITRVQSLRHVGLHGDRK